MSQTVLIRCVQRPETNVYYTIANMLCADPCSLQAFGKIHVISGDNKTGFMRSLSQMDRVVIHSKPTDHITGWKPKRRGAWSYSYAMHEARVRCQDAIVMEDDITFSNGWHSRMMATVEKIRTVLSTPFVLSAYHRHKLVSERGYEPVPAYDPCRNATHFWGNLCTFWCKELIAGFCSYFDDIIKRSDDMSTDLSVHAYATKVGAPFFVTVPSLVQHMGDKTTLRQDGIRRGPMFESFYTGK